MKRITTTIAAVCAVALLVPVVGASAKPDRSKRLAVQECKQERRADKGAFRATHGPRAAMRNCIRGNDSEIESEFKNAAKECKAERDADPEGFRETYGTNTGNGNAKGAGRNAFGKCVGGKVRAEVREDIQAFREAAKTCRDERQADPEGFRETYGTNEPNETGQGRKRNAFGKCVSMKVKEGNTEEEPEA